MNLKERIQKAIRFEETDIVPYHLKFTIPAYEKLAEYYRDRDFIREIGNHLAIIEPKAKDAWAEIKPGFFRDEFGVVWDRTIDKNIGTVVGSVLEKPVLEGYIFPDPYKKDRFAGYEEFIKENADKFILNEIGFSLFERAWTLRGMEDLLMDMVVNPGFVEELLDRILDWNLAIIDQAAQYDIDGCRFGDDWGQQQGLIMGPKLWRKFIKPRLARMYGKVREKGLPVFIHSCGDVREIFPDLIEIGVDVFNPFQPEVMDIYEMKKKYGRELCFYGGLSTQRTLPYGTPDDVKEESRRLMKEIGKGGGYILSPAHSVPKDVPLENLLALIEVVQDQ